MRPQKPKKPTKPEQMAKVAKRRMLDKLVELLFRFDLARACKKIELLTELVFRIGLLICLVLAVWSLITHH